MGKELKNHLLATGFTEIRANGSFDYFDTTEKVAFLHYFIIDRFFMPQVIAAATQYGLATDEQFEQWRREMDHWKDISGAVGVLAFGEVIGAKP